MGLGLKYNYLPKQKGQSLRIDALFLAKVYALKPFYKREIVISFKLAKKYKKIIYVNNAKIIYLHVEDLNKVYFKKTLKTREKILLTLVNHLVTTLNITYRNKDKLHVQKIIFYEDFKNVFMFIKNLITEYSLDTLYDNFGKHYKEFLNEQSKVADFYYELISDDTKNGYPLFLDYETTNKM